MTVRQLLRKYGNILTKDLNQAIRDNKLVASGDSLASIRFDTKKLKLNIHFDEQIAIQNEGIRSKKIPSSTAILKWMKDKNIRPIEGASRKAGLLQGRSKFSKGGSDSRNMKASAFAIARSIARKGTIKRFGYKGSGVLDVLEPESRGGKEMIRELQIIAERDLDSIFTINTNPKIKKELWQ
jgi:hypothetical protein